MKKVIVGLVMVGLLASVRAETTFPLKVDIDVSTKHQRESIGAGRDGEAKVEKVQVNVKIRKSGGTLPAGKLTAELYVIGKQIHTGYLGIIDVQKGPFELTKENDYTFEYQSPKYALGKTSGNIEVGGEYETYLVVVSDAQGNLIDSRCGRAIEDKGIAFIRKLGPKTLFDRDGNVIGELKNPGEALKRAIPAAVDPGDDD